MSEIQALIKKIKLFISEREWDQFHNPKDLAIALNIESSELLRIFLWKRYEEVNVGKVKEELADIITFALNLAEKFDLDIVEIVEEKLRINSEKYPVEKSKGTSKKYTDL